MKKTELKISKSLAAQLAVAYERYYHFKDKFSENNTIVDAEEVIKWSYELGRLQGLTGIDMLTHTSLVAYRKKANDYLEEFNV